MTSEELAWNIRKDAIKMVHVSHASHIGAVLSVTDIIAVLYADVLKVVPEEPYLASRDRLILSKGHAGVAIYAALAETGFIPKADLEQYYKDGSVYSGHVSSKGVPGVELSTGSLGNGIGVACGMALAAKNAGKDYKVYAIVGDGECEEGIVWEIAMFANRYSLSNFTVIVDKNGMQAMGSCDDVIALGNLGKKWNSFGWNAIEVADGNDHNQLREAFQSRSNDKPNVIIANTIKGKGISFMENNLLWHYRDPQGDDFENAMKELEGKKP